MKKTGKLVGNIFIGALILIVITAAAGLFYFKSYLPNTVAPRSFPQIDGEIQAEGLNAPVDIYRDAMGIPHIYATTAHDLFFAQGYVHAQDRFWQMDTWRHIGSGELSKMFGAGQVETDAFLRTLGWRKTAEAEWEALGPESRAVLQSYAEGVNAYLKDHSDTALSLEYAVLGLLSPEYEIEAWTPIHSLTWGKAMAWDLRGNMGDEIERAELLKVMPPEQVAQLFPDYPEDHPVIVNEMPVDVQMGNQGEAGLLNFDYSQLPLDHLSYNASLLDPVLGEIGDGIGSNSWAVSGALTDTGRPYLANDPHLGIQMPSIWYQIGLHCAEKSDECPFEAAGFSFAGVPGVIIGHNDKIAWGFTNVGPDVMDLFIEKVNPENPNQYEVNGEWVNFETYEEIIEVVGGEPVTITVKKTRHGPVISEAYGLLKNEGDPDDKEFIPFKDRSGVELPEQYVIALAWTALTPSTPFEAIWGFDKAQNWEEFREAARGFHVPAQNLLYADVEGNIGYQMPGDVPIRKNGDGTLPVPGWTDDYEWTGFIPFEEQPYALNPEEGYIVTANNQVNPWDYPYLITKDWDYGYRAQRIVEMIEGAPGKIDKAYIQSMHSDSTDLGAQALLPVWDEIDFKAATPNQAIALDMMQNWDFKAASDSQAAAIYQWFWWNLLQNTLNDELPERMQKNGGRAGGSPDFEVMRNLVKSPDDPFWDDKTTTSVVETRNDIYAVSLVETVEQLEKEHGKDPAKWPRWGELHTATFRNGTLGESGVSLIEDLFNRGAFETGGGKSIVNATGWDVGVSFEVDWLPSMRMIVDFSNLNDSLTVHTTGQSGHAYHPHYIDMAPLWADVKYYPMWWDRESIISDSEGHLVLKP
ncbi:MAG: penicillin acylase family protein [Anaerolineaceae bacterium]|jgi:penicillin amidase|nr:MAG: penicillin acylase family protein [Anaerolineaceae bacterium]